MLHSKNSRSALWVDNNGVRHLQNPKTSKKMPADISEESCSPGCIALLNGHCPGKELCGFFDDSVPKTQAQVLQEYMENGFFIEQVL